MADTVDPATSSSPADEAEKPRDAAPTDGAEQPREAPPAAEAKEPGQVAAADEAEKSGEAGGDDVEKPVEAPLAEQADGPVETAPVDEVERPEEEAAPAAEAGKPEEEAAPADEAQEPESEAAEEAEKPEEEAEKPAEEAEGPEEERSVTELLEQLGGKLGDLGLSEAQLEAARNLPAVRRAAREIAGALVVVVAALTAFAFINVAAVAGLSRVMATPLAALVLAAFWLVVAAVLFGFMKRARRWLLWIVLKAPSTSAVEELERERDAAAKAARSTLEELGPQVAIQIALAAVPKAGDVAGGVVEVGDSVLDATDETVEAIAEQVPGGGVVNQVWDIALMPGRLGIRVATTVLRRGRPADKQ